MNKTLSVMAGLGVGAVLGCLFDRARRGTRGGSARRAAANVASGAEGVVVACPHGVLREDVETDDGAVRGRSTSRRGNGEVAVDDYASASGRHDPHESPPGGSPLGSTRGSLVGGRPWDSREAGILVGTSSMLSSARRMLPGVVRGGRLLYRLICRVSFGACVCAAGLSLVKRVLDGKPSSGAANLSRERLSGKERAVLTGLVSLAFLTRRPLLRLPQTPFSPDGVYYATLGRRLVAGNFGEGLSTFWPPLYPFLVGLSSLVSRDVERGGRLVSVAAGSLLVIPVYLLCRVLYGEGVAPVAALLVAAHPILIHYSTLLLTEATYTLLLTTVMYAGLRALSTLGRAHFLVTGAALGACYLTRPEAIGYAALMSALTLGAHLAASHQPRSAALSNVLSLLSGFSLLALPYILYLRRATGRWTVSDKLHSHVESDESRARRWFGLKEGRQTTLADRLYAGLREVGASSDRRAPSPPDARSLRTMAGRCVEALGLEIRLLIYRLSPPHFTVLVGLGLFKAGWAKEIYLLLFLGSTLAGYALYPDIVAERLLVPLLPLTLCWAANGIGEVETWLGRLLVRMRLADAGSLRKPMLPRLLVLTAFLCLTLPWIAYTLLRRISGGRPEYERAGEWVRGQAETPALIMAADPHTAFYAGGRALYLPIEEYSTVIEHARRHAVDYLVIDEEVISQNVEYANLRFLLDERSPHPGLRLAYKFDDVPRHKILVFTLT